MATDFLAANPGVYVVIVGFALVLVVMVIYVLTSSALKGGNLLVKLQTLDLIYPIEPRQRHIHNMVSNFRDHQSAATAEITQLVTQIRKEFLDRFAEMKAKPEFDKNKIFEELSRQEVAEEVAGNIVAFTRRDSA
jgi:hypothetical protein